MNKKQKYVLWIGIAVFLLVGLNPHCDRVPVRRHTRGFISYAPGKHPSKLVFDWGPEDVRRLSFYWVMIAVVTSVLIDTFKEKKKKIEELKKD